MMRLDNVANVEKPTLTTGDVKLFCNHLSVSFGATRALRDLHLEFRAGEIVGLLGHNGAGKSTFVNVVTGALNGYDGSVRVAGHEIPRGSRPRDLGRLGVSVLYQEPALVSSLSIRDNLFLGHPITTSDELAQTVLGRVGASTLTLDRPVSSLTLGERQMVGLARGLIGGQPEVLLLDEPTAALGKEETDALHEVIREFALQGTAVVYISHRLRDIYDICTRIVILQEGGLELDRPIGELTMANLTAALAPDLGNSDLPERTAKPTSRTLLNLPQSPGPDLVFREGEIVGLFGMAAGAQFGILNTLFGLDDQTSFTLGDEEIRVRTPENAVARGIHLVPADREVDGLLPNLSAIDNVFMPWMKSKRLRSRGVRNSMYAKIRADYGIQGPPGEASIAAFSGGNRQKHLLARWSIPIRPRLLLLSQPTQGVDIQAKRDIRRVIAGLADQGSTVLVASAEADEIAALCSRSYVFTGTSCHEVPGGDGFETRLITTLLEDQPGGLAS